MGFWKEVKKAGKKVEKVVRSARDKMEGREDQTRGAIATYVAAQIVVGGASAAINKPN